MQTIYETVAEARTRLKDVLDAAGAGVPVHVRRGADSFSVVDDRFLVEMLRSPLPVPQAIPEDDGWSIVLWGTPVAADGVLFTDAVDDFVVALREYAQDWVDDEAMRSAANHRDNFALVQWVHALDDAALRSWVVGESADAE